MFAVAVRRSWRRRPKAPASPQASDLGGTWSAGERTYVVRHGADGVLLVQGAAQLALQRDPAHPARWHGKDVRAGALG